MVALLLLQLTVVSANFAFLFDSDYDYYLFVVEWKPSQCYSRKCPVDYLNSNFNIHGLWPERWSGTYPESCGSDYSFEISEETSESLMSYWLSYNGDQKVFWEHEWTKHGTCVTPAITCNTYFELGVQMYEDLKILETLQSKGVIPSNAVEVNRTAVQTAFSNTIDLLCLTYSKKQYLSTLRFCYDKDFKKIDCKGSNSCKATFWFPLAEQANLINSVFSE
ncbi:unnamed protein product [Blepharisma stoltei]|uniref:Uncharacterized protein n=1 Tax=Blepharisma stoltei TaxID=1481888 RepID=A0AAU9JPJ1_9CILI|nr:unnamed protein product [Blepharisma stoltei]